MKIKSLKLENYGIFQQRQFHLGTSPIVLLYGANEAGKSTLLQALRESLFGMSLSSELTSAKTITEVTATLGNGEPLHFRRRRGRKNLVDGKFGTSGRPLDEHILSELLSPSNMTSYRSLFGFSLAELSRGQHSFEGVSLTEALLGTGRGATLDWKRARKALDDRRDALLTKQGKNQTIPKLVNEIRDTTKALEDATTRPSEYLNLRGRLQAIEEEQNQIVASKTQLSDKLRHTARMIQAVPILLAIRDAESKLKQLTVPEKITRLWCEQWRSNLAQRAALEKSEFQIAQERIELEVASTQIKIVDAPDLDLERMRSLVAQIPLNEQLTQRMDRWNHEKVATEKRIVELRISLDVAIQEALPTGIRVSPQTKDSLRDLIAEIRATVQQVELLGSQISQARIKRVQLSGAIQTPNDTESTEPLREILAMARRGLHDAQKIAAEHGQSKSEQAELGTLEEKLGQVLQVIPKNEWAGVFPKASTIDAFSTRFREHGLQVTALEQQQEIAHAEHMTLEAQFAEIANKAELASLEDLQKLRRVRQELWCKWLALADHPPKSNMPLFDSERELARERYLDHLAKEDAMVDSLLQHAETFARREQLEKRIHSLKSTIASIGVSRAENEKRLAALDGEWQDLWKFLNASPGTPDAMRIIPAEFERLVALRTAEKSRRGFELTVQDDLHRIKQDLLAVIERSSSEVDSITRIEPLNHMQIIEFIETRLAFIQRRQGEQAALSLQYGELEADIRRKELEHAEFLTKRDSQVAQFEVWLKTHGLPAFINYQHAEEVVDRLCDLFDNQQELELVEKELKRASNTIDEFGLAIHQFLQQFAAIHVTADSGKNIESFKKIVESVELANRQRDSLQQNAARLDEKHKQLVTIAEAKESLGKEQVSLCEALELPNCEQANRVANVAEDYWRFQSEIAKREKQIEALCDSTSLDEFMNQLSNANLTELQQQQRNLNDALKSTQIAYDKIMFEKGQLSQQLSAMYDDEKVTMLSTKLEDLKAKLDESANQWMALSVSLLLLERSLQEFKASNEREILDLVRQYFRRLTLDRYIDVRPDPIVEHAFHVVDHDGQEKKPEQLSTGTREQLYLAVRLAFIQQYCRHHEPLPIVMDDCFVNFDDDRVRQTLEVIHEWDSRVQCILLTCHRRMIDIVQSTCHNATVIELASDLLPLSSNT